jgi:hypothetical protein
MMVLLVVLLVLTVLSGAGGAESTRERETIARKFLSNKNVIQKTRRERAFVEMNLLCMLLQKPVLVLLPGSLLPSHSTKLDSYEFRRQVFSISVRSVSYSYY